MKGWLVALLLILLSLEGGVSLAHKHEDGKLHLDCSLCLFNANQQLEEKPQIEPKPLELLRVYIDQTFKPQKPVCLFIDHFYSRAPPA
ncbi:MAG: hypothetical protein KNN13_05230 [Hydrogenobacter thermophilus]|uniref:hypothetical protein n=1 Tax=Hydrogenobacter thermophilus TaxID=940 RepID=UPI000CBFF524|nr:hypothetical protein [Hydrogenobacter thermophilus]QWK18929.1 MAG: hypothetical protein KNN13_05230 [Hydrogenobacter thermophilus]GBC88916.1 hypothetical protein HRbin13_01048 [bacterium HR13]